MDRNDHRELIPTNFNLCTSPNPVMTNGLLPVFSCWVFETGGIPGNLKLLPRCCRQSFSVYLCSKYLVYHSGKDVFVFPVRPTY